MNLAVINSRKSRKTILKGRQVAPLPKSFVGFIASWGVAPDSFENNVPGLANIAVNGV